MPTYYEILKVQPTASNAEIQVAIDAQYNQWRRLATHRNPRIVDEANHSLRTLEEIRSILTDSKKRAEYDIEIGMSNQINGLADPEIFLQKSKLSPPLFNITKSFSREFITRRVDAWICSKCQTANQIEARYCVTCGQQIGRNCPKCLKLIEFANLFCPHCGVDVAAFLQQRRVEEDARLRLEQIKEATRLKKEQEKARRRAEEEAKTKTRAKTQTRLMILVGIIAFVMTALLMFASFGYWKWVNYEWGAQKMSFTIGDSAVLNGVNITVRQSSKNTCKGFAFEVLLQNASPITKSVQLMVSRSPWAGTPSKVDCYRYRWKNKTISLASGESISYGFRDLGSHIDTMFDGKINTVTVITEDRIVATWFVYKW
ncbi:MAG: zinc ribbon domain-containing protein [Anaerolineae bacterium]|nr:zinc ribbon domain-containing protein [Anaerolineae bacterium]